MIKNTDKPFERMFAVLDYVASSLRAVSTTEISEEPERPLDKTNRIVANLVAQEILRCVEDVRQRVIGPVLDPEMGFARQVADRIVFMDHGAIVEEDTPETFFKSPKTDRAREFLSQIVH
ncbi:glnQ [Bartonella apihabitans]